eukprot:TRINITY_DN96463_c0_g1_i1.p1 TRINITY_DN96463_c0_g1~~TRINITY_DN96463_c0_g1_i1.p1  ORF type:complete len:224 (+),score=40.63 TRINITY_DN96463_c0_g1_i1:51-722(+)
MPLLSASRRLLALRPSCFRGRGCSSMASFAEKLPQAIASLHVKGGRIDRAELNQAIKNVDPSCTEAELTRFWQVVDPGQGGYTSTADLKDYLSGPGLLRAKAMEIAIAFSPADYAEYQKTKGAIRNAELATGYKCSGTFAGRNIEQIYQKAEEAGMPCSLPNAVEACFGPGGPRHVLLSSGFYVLHELGAHAEPGCAPGSCETDGPLGVLALVRAFAFRGVHQ